ncbi:(S)-2-haloacid dehalogenase IVA [Pleomassaria siparia CBS 279.74]|uniref:(S)-2-haloacid dehalogenase IVA n=1 Tax=Pleomassaria siparia CBS 279.74 TaxID=1314801 RepID=A0A6G1KN04_9PLEO|nr:(S)-2-haloacid dehalogenase IVA [Pleomassaria siparia CBS 279.74]
MPPRQRAIFFDLMGTCCDWLSSLLPLLKSCPAHSSIDAKEVALAWRAGFFDEIHKRYTRGDPAEDINITHRRVLDRILDMKGIGEDLWSEDIRERLVQQWHMQMPWSDVIPALTKLREDKDTTWLLVVLANGTTRLQLDIAASSAIPFHTLFSSELLGLTKPDPAIYRKAMDLVRLPPLACIMLASHLYDLEAAKGVGMRTIYVHRDTEDVGEVIDPLTIVPDGKHSHIVKALRT